MAGNKKKPSPRQSPTRHAVEDELYISGARSRTARERAVEARRGVSGLESKLSGLNKKSTLLGFDMNKDAKVRLASQIDTQKKATGAIELKEASSREEYKKKWQAAYKKYGSSISKSRYFY